MFEGWGGPGQGAPNVPLPIPFNPDSTSFSLAYVSLRFFDCKILCVVVYLFLSFSHFPQPWESHFPPSLFPLIAHFSFSFLSGSRPPPLFEQKQKCNCDWFRFTPLCDRLTMSHCFLTQLSRLFTHFLHA